jgi:RNA-directed DNA polymerase
MRQTNRSISTTSVGPVCLPDGSRVRRESHARFGERPAVKFHRPTQPFGPHCYTKDGSWYTGASPSKKSVARIKQKVGDLLTPNNVGTWSEVRDRLNQMLKGWAAYFSYGTRRQVYQAIDYHVYDCVRHFLRRRHKVPTRGTTRFPYQAVFGELGVFRLRRSCLGVPRS